MLSVTITAVIGIFSTFISWMAYTAALSPTLMALNTTMASGLTGEASTAFSGIMGVGLKIIGIWMVLTVIGLVAWWLINAQQKEDVYGVRR